MTPYLPLLPSSSCPRGDNICLGSQLWVVELLNTRNRWSSTAWQSDIKYTTQGPRCHHPSLLGNYRWTTGVKGGTNTAHTALHPKISLRRLKGQVHVRDATNISKPCSDGKGTKRQSKRCNWRSQYDGGSGYWLSDVDLRQQLHPSAPWTTKQPSLGTALLTLRGEGPRKCGLTEARLSSLSWLAAVNGHLLKQSQNIKTGKVCLHLQ